MNFLTSLNSPEISRSFKDHPIQLLSAALKDLRWISREHARVCRWRVRHLLSLYLQIILYLEWDSQTPRMPINFGSEREPKRFKPYLIQLSTLTLKPVRSVQFQQTRLMATLRKTRSAWGKAGHSLVDPRVKKNISIICAVPTANQPPMNEPGLFHLKIQSWTLTSSAGWQTQ